jgi:hypothetical protein
MTDMSGGSGLHLAKQAEFLSASEATLIKWIEGARENITFLGAGLSLKLAQALVRQKHLLAGGIILDNDQQVYQSGYGDVAAVRLLQANKVHLGQGRNLRLNILVCDHKALIYSPTPVVLEDAPTRQAPRASGLVIDAPAVLNLLASLVPLEAKDFKQAPALEELLPDQAGGEYKPETGLNQAGARRPVTRLPVCDLTEPEIGRAEQAVAQHPPRLDLSKVLRVYKGKLQFVEVSLTGCNLERHRVSIPQDLLKLSKRAKDNRLQASYELFPPTCKTLQRARRLQEELDALRKFYTIPLKGYGVVLLLKDRQEFDEQFHKLEVQVEEVKASLKLEIEQIVEETVTRICRLLYANVKRYPPDNLALFLRKDEGDREKLGEYILGKLRQAVGNPQSYVTDMELRCIYKDVTLEMLEKDEFKKAVNETRLRKVFDNEDLVVIGLAAVYKEEEGQDLFNLGN